MSELKPVTKISFSDVTVFPLDLDSGEVNGDIHEFRRGQHGALLERFGDLIQNPPKGYEPDAVCFFGVLMHHYAWGLKLVSGVNADGEPYVSDVNIVSRGDYDFSAHP